MKQYRTTYVYIAACIGIMFFGVSFIIMGAVLPSLASKYALNELESSILVTFLPIGLLLGTLIFGPIVDRFGYKKLICISSVSISLGLLGLSMLHDIALIRGAVFLIGLGGGMLNGITNSLVPAIYEGKQAASRLSFLGMCYGIGALTIPLLFSVCSKYYSYETILVWTALIVLASIIYFLSIEFPKPNNKQDIGLKDILRLIKTPSLLILAFILFFQSGLEGLLNNWSTTYLIDASVVEKDALLALSALILGITFGRFLLGYLIKILNPAYIYIGEVILLVMGIIGLNNTSTFGEGAISLSIIGIGLAGVYPLVLERIGSLFADMTGTAIGIALFIALNGNSLLNHIMGFVSDQYKIAVFPKFLLVCVILQVSLMLIGRKYLVNKQT